MDYSRRAVVAPVVTGDDIFMLYSLHLVKYGFALRPDTSRTASWTNANTRTPLTTCVYESSPVNTFRDRIPLFHLVQHDFFLPRPNWLPSQLWSVRRCWPARVNSMWHARADHNFKIPEFNPVLLPPECQLYQWFWTKSDPYTDRSRFRLSGSERLGSCLIGWLSSGSNSESFAWRRFEGLIMGTISDVVVFFKPRFGMNVSHRATACQCSISTPYWWRMGTVT